MASPNGNQISWMLWTSPRLDSLEEAILCTLSYADVFNYPLTQTEMHRYLVGVTATKEDIVRTARSLKSVSESDGYFTLSGRESNVGIRLRREKIASFMWPRSITYGQAIARLPFVRMVALTGALPVRNVESGDDYDYLIVAARGHVWVTRRLIVQLVVKRAAIHGDEICPNYILSEDALLLPERDLFHAHELAHMIPLFGIDVYSSLRQANSWSETFLPNASGCPDIVPHLPQPGGLGRSVSERILGAFAGRWLERQEMARLQRRLCTQGNCQEVQLSPLSCKGHTGAHSHSTFQAFAARIEQRRPDSSEGSRGKPRLSACGGSSGDTERPAAPSTGADITGCSADSPV